MTGPTGGDDGTGRMTEPEGGRLPRLDRASADIRNAVRALLAEAPAGSLDHPGAEVPAAAAQHVPESAPQPAAEYVLAVSGGADSMALAAACAHLGTRPGPAPSLRSGPGTRPDPRPNSAPGPAAPAPRFHAVVVDHGLQDGSAATAAAVVEHLHALGLSAEAVRVAVDPAHGGVEAAARSARYAALESIRATRGSAAILTGHTRDDQAETVLLGLLRGSGARSLAGMRPRAGQLWRPLLDITRAQTRASCTAAGIPVWDDPMNTDPRFARVRARTRVLPVLEAELGPGAARALARTAALLAADSDALEAQAAAARPAHTSGPEVHATAAELPQAVRTRVLRDWLRDHAGTAQEVGAHHVEAVDELLTGRRRGAVSVPGSAEVRRTAGGGLIFTRLGPPAPAGSGIR